MPLSVFCGVFLSYGRNSNLNNFFLFLCFSFILCSSFTFPFAQAPVPRMNVYTISNPALIKKIFDVLDGDTPEARSENWRDREKLSDTDLNNFKNLLGMSGPSGKIRPVWSFAPDNKYFFLFESNKPAYPGCKVLAQVKVWYDEKTDEAYYTEEWPWA